MSYFKVLDEKDGYKLLEEKTINDRTLLCYYNPTDRTISLMLFHLTDQPNSVSKRSPYTTWGYLTFFTTNMMSEKEAAEVVSLYLQDMEKDNYFWESIN